MTNKKLYTLIFSSLLLLLIFSCSSGKKAFENGNYYTAVIKSVNRLRQNPNHKKSKETLKKSYPLALKTFQQNAQNALNENHRFKYKTVLRNYQSVNSMYEEISRSPGAMKIIPRPLNYYNKLPLLREQAAEESYAAATETMKLNTREAAKEAYYLYVDALEFVPNYKDAFFKRDEAKFEATLKIVVEQIPVPRKYNLSGNFFQDKIEEYLHNYNKNEFIRFYTPREAKIDELPYVDQYLHLEFDEFVIGRTNYSKNTETITKDSVKVGTVKLDDGTEKAVYNTVKAKLTFYKKEVISNGTLSMRIFDGNNDGVLLHKKLSGEFVWVNEWANFNGDERALSEEDLNICEGSELSPPDSQNLFIEFTKPIYDQLIQSINEYYKNL